MTAVCHKRLACRHPQCDRSGKAEFTRRRGDGDFGGAQAETVDLDGQWEAAEDVHNLRFIDDADEAMRCGGDDLLASEGGASAFDEAQMRIRFVGAVE